MDTKLDPESGVHLSDAAHHTQTRSFYARNKSRLALTLIAACLLAVLSNTRTIGARKCSLPLSIEQRVERILTETPLIGKTIPNNSFLVDN